MIGKRIAKFILIIFSILLVASVSTAFVISQNGHHIDKCCDTDCIYCNIIHMAQELIYKVLISNSCLAFVFIISYITSKIYTYYYIVIPKSLVSQNVQLNE